MSLSRAASRRSFFNARRRPGGGRRRESSYTTRASRLLDSLLFEELARGLARELRLAERGPGGLPDPLLFLVRGGLERLEDVGRGVERAALHALADRDRGGLADVHRVLLRLEDGEERL